MFSVNPERLKDASRQLRVCAELVAEANDQLLEVLAVVKRMKPLDTSAPKFNDLSNHLLQEKESLIKLSRALDMSASIYHRSEKRIEANCSGSKKTTIPAKIIQIPGVPQYLRNTDEQ